MAQCLAALCCLDVACSGAVVMTEGHFFKSRRACLRQRKLTQRCIILALPLLSALKPAQAGPATQPLPQRNLLVSWRVQSQSETTRDASALQRGAVVVGTDGGMRGRAVITYGSAQAQASGEGEMQVLVLNGAQARLSLGQQRPYTQWQLAFGLAPAPTQAASSPNTAAASGQALTVNTQGYAPSLQAYSTTTWVDTGQGLRVRPSWPGGQAPVTLVFDTRSEVSDASRALGSQGGELPPVQVQAESTVRVPLDRWVVVARTGGQAQQSQRGTYSTGELGQSGHTVLEIKVSLP